MSASLISNTRDGGFTILINLTPHTVSIINGERVTEIEPSGEIARIAAISEKIGTAASLPLFVTRYGNVTGLPPAQSGTFFIVSSIVRIAHPERTDLLSPSGLLRNSEGRVVGCTGFDVNP